MPIVAVSRHRTLKNPKRSARLYDLIGLAIFILDIYMIFLILTGSGTVGIKVLWMLVVLLLPLLGPILYFLLGRGTAA